MKDESLSLAAANPPVTPQKSVTTLENNLHKDLFGAISGIGNHFKIHFTLLFSV